MAAWSSSTMSEAPPWTAATACWRSRAAASSRDSPDSAAMSSRAMAPLSMSMSQLVSRSSSSMVP